MKSTIRRAAGQGSKRQSPSQLQTPAANGAAPAPQLWHFNPRPARRSEVIPVAGLAHHEWDGDGIKDHPTWYLARVLAELSAEILAVLAAHAPGARPSVHLAEALVIATQVSNRRAVGCPMGQEFELPGLVAHDQIDLRAIEFACGRGVCENYSLLRDHLLPTLAPRYAFRFAEALAVANKLCGEFTDGRDTANDGGVAEEIEALCYQYYWQVLTSGGAR